MASVFGHGLVAVTITKIATYRSLKLLLILAIVSSILPDIDVIGFRFGIAYEHPFGHRGFTHSILFALIWAILITTLIAKSRKLLWFLVILCATLSHGLLDAITTGGRGVGFFIPFHNERYFFPWRKIMVSPIYVEDFFSDWGVAVIFSEIKYIVMPCAVVLVISFFVNKMRK